MADRRMFSKKVTDSDQFIEMSAAAQALYFHLNQGADDDGFNNQIQNAMFKAHAGVDDLKILMAKRFIIRFESGVIVIKHWRMHNTLRKDRYVPTNFQEELAQLGIKENGAYTFGCQKVAERLPDGCQTVASGKDRLVEDSIVEDNKRYIVEQSPTLPPELPEKEPENESEKPGIPYKEIIECLNRNAGTHYKATTKATQRLIHARFREGFTKEDFETVIRDRCLRWLKDKKMAAYLRPETLFGPKFEGYLNNARRENTKNGPNGGDPEPRYGVYL